MKPQPMLIGSTWQWCPAGPRRQAAADGEVSGPTGRGGGSLLRNAAPGTSFGARVRVSQECEEATPMIDRARLTEIYARERHDFLAWHPKSAAAYARSDHLFGRVPMTWMNK